MKKPRMRGAFSFVSGLLNFRKGGDEPLPHNENENVGAGFIPARK